jgi:hypothetical protein
LAHRTLVLLEAQSLHSEFLNYLIRTLLSEGRAKYLTTEKDVDGAFRSREIVREGPTGLLVTTTAAAIESQTETRILSVTVNDTPAQTKRIMRAIACTPRNERKFPRICSLLHMAATSQNDQPQRIERKLLAQTVRTDGQSLSHSL